MQEIDVHLTGLTSQQVQESRALHGENKITTVKTSTLLSTIKHVLKEPMLLLLLAASVVYYLHGDIAEAIFLSAAIVIVYSISRFQEVRSDNALRALKKLSQPKCKVIRDRKAEEINSEELVVNDLLIVDEGSLIPADGKIIQSNDFTVDESILTGESIPVEKDETPGKNIVYQGTSVTSGLAICQVEAVGSRTSMAQIGKSIEKISEESSPLQIQIEDFVKKMAITGLVVFVIIFTVNAYETESFSDSLLKSLTLAMSILPEEIPVAFATFMALGAWRLMRVGIIVKDIKTVETLGSATVLCVDKTGTITRNEMSLEEVYVHKDKRVFTTEAAEISEVITVAMWASEPIPFDPMEKALHNMYSKLCTHDFRRNFKLVKEYPLSGKPPIMTHIFQSEAGETIIAAKGAPEAIITQSTLSIEEKEKIRFTLNQLASKGYRVLGVAQAENNDGKLPARQQDFVFTFKGLVAFLDPPKENIEEVFNKFYKAGIKVKIITGDNPLTTATVADRIKLQGASNVITGDQLMALTTPDLERMVARTTIFARMFPEAKLKVVDILKKQSEVVAMTGDGVNDGPALKAAHIGIAMGKKGSEVAKQASALILVDDDLSRLVDALAMGRKVYNNLKKGIQYIISIHIPIILIVFLPLILGWMYPAIFSPVHVIFLELIMGPTCSIIYENEPIEQNIMDLRPRAYTKRLFSVRELSTSIIQGLCITAGLIFIYWFAVHASANIETVTAMVFLALVAANITLTLVNRSFLYSVLTTLKYRNALVPLGIATTILLVGLIFAIPPVRSFFDFEIPSSKQLILSIATGFISVIWFEVYKLINKKAVMKASFAVS